MNYMMQPGEGRDLFVRYWQLMAQEVAQHPSAVGFELMNEPMSIRRQWMYDTWKATADAIIAVIPDASVAVTDTGEGVIPNLALEIFRGHLDLNRKTRDWLES